jgi:hypothetical protein
MENSKWSKTAITGFITSILWIYGLGSITAIILGIISIIKVNKSNGKLKGKGFSIASIILGLIGLIIGAIPLWILTVAVRETLGRYFPW